MCHTLALSMSGWHCACLAGKVQGKEGKVILGKVVQEKEGKVKGKKGKVQEKEWKVKGKEGRGQGKEGRG